MKRFVMVIALVAIIATGTAFADDGFGIGALWGGSLNSGQIGSHAALALKFPSVPIYWAVRAGGFDSTLWVGLQGDKYLIDDEVVETLSWFLGVGGYLNVHLSDDIALGLGVRVPIGMRWRPIDFFELFFNVAPNLGGYMWTHGDGGFDFPHGGFFGFEIGIRFWP